MNAGWGISPLKSTRFHLEIWWISPVKSGRFHLWNPPKIIKASVLAKTLQFDECRVGAMTKDFMKFTLKSGGFHPWNLADFTQISLVKSTQIIKASVSAKTLQFDECRVGAMTKDLTCEIQQSSPWNLVDLTCEIQWISPRYHLWNPPKIIKASVSAKTLQFDECRVGDFTLKSSGFHPWNLADFTQISPVKSTQNYKSKCFSKNSSVWWMQGGVFHPRNSVDFTLKSGGFQLWNLVDFTQISPVKSTQNYKSKCFSKNSSVWWMQGGGFHPWNPPDITCEIHPKL